MTEANEIIKKYEQAQTGNEQDAENFFTSIWDLLTISQEAHRFQYLDLVNWFVNKPALSVKTSGLALFTLAYIHFFKDNFETSIQFIQKALINFHTIHFDDGIAICHSLMGNNYRSLGDVELSVQNHLEGEKQLSKSSKYIRFRISSKYQIADIYQENENYEMALAIYEELLLLNGTSNIKILLPRIYNGMGVIYSKLERYDLALYYLDKALSFCIENNYHSVAARVLTDIGGFYFILKDYEKAIDYNRQAMAIREKYHLKNALITNQINLSKIYEIQELNHQAIDMLEKAHEHAIVLKVKAKANQIQYQLAELYEKEHDYENSLNYYKKYIKTEHELYHEDLENKIKSIKLISEAEQTQKENIIINKQKIEIENKNAKLEETLNNLTATHHSLELEKKRSDDLLLNILPLEIAEELKNNGYAEAKYYEHVTVLFTDFVGFTKVAEILTPQQLVEELDTCFKYFDAVMEKYHIEKIKTIGDAYLAVAGLPLPCSNHAEKVANAAIEIVDFIKVRKIEKGDSAFNVRIGIHTGAVIAGIVGHKKFAFDIWGDTVNTAARMEQNSEAGKINISQQTYLQIKDKFECQNRGAIKAKNKGDLEMYFISN